MRNFNAADYINLVENSNISELNFYMDAEKDVISNIKNKSNKSIIDLGSGYGRLLPYLSEKFKNAYAIEINSKMIVELKNRANNYKNTNIIKGDICDLSRLLKGSFLNNSLIALFQNTLGTIEGDWKKVLHEMRKFSEKNNSSIFISFFRADSMNGWGKNVLFPYLEPMIGDIDYEKSDLVNGFLYTTTKYTSKWWKDEEIDEIVESFNKKIIIEKQSEIFKIFYLK